MDKKLKIIIENCPQNHKCPAVNVCPVGALSQKDFEAPIIDYDNYFTQVSPLFPSTVLCVLLASRIS